MYKEYKLRIKPLSTYITPWHSDTFVGHILWAIRYMEGIEELNKIKDEIKKGNPPFIFSNGLINGKFPKPNYPILERANLINIGEKHYGNNYYTALKKIKKLNILDEEEFNIYIDGFNIENFLKEKLIYLKEKGNFPKVEGIKSENISHNVINRISGGTSDESLYSLVENFVGENHEIVFLLKLREDFPLDKLKKYIEYIELNGYGKKASSGKGAFKVISLEENNIKIVDNPNAFIVLSNYIPKEGDYEEVLSADTITKYAKVGGTEEEHPFKRPFIAFTSGSLFKGNTDGIKGKALENIHYNKDIIQFGMAYTIGVRIDE